MSEPESEVKIEMTLGGECCFCRTRIHARGPDPVEISLNPADEGSQLMWAHADCVRKAVHPSMYLVTDIYNDDEPEATA